MEWSVQSAILLYLKNWLKVKHIFVLIAYVWEAAPCSTLPAADENTVTESAVTTSQPQFLRRITRPWTSKQKETATTDLFQDSQRADPCK